MTETKIEWTDTTWNPTTGCDRVSPGCDRNESYKQRMAQRPFDVDGGANGRILIKRQDGGWGYRHRSWEYGPLFVPSWRQDPESLFQVLDRAHGGGGSRSVSPRWLEWKQAHPDLFPVVTS